MAIKAPEYKYDRPEYLPTSRAYFRDFWNENRKSQFYYAYKDYKFGYTAAYGYFYRSDEVEQLMRDIYLNLTETFGNVTIPGEFPSPYKLVLSWYNYYNYLNSKDKLFIEVKEYYKNQEQSKDKIEELFNEELPEPFFNIEEIKDELKEVLYHILHMPETNELVRKVEQDTRGRRR